MGDTTSRNLRVKCPTWAHVETFCERKLHGDRTLTMRVPFEPHVGQQVVLSLELPDGMVLAIDGEVMQARPSTAAQRAAVQLRLFGMTDQVLGRLRTLVREHLQAETVVPEPAAAPRRPRTEPPAPRPQDAPVDEIVEPPPTPTSEGLDDAQRAVFDGLRAELVALRERAAHEVLGVAWDAGAEQIRAGYLALVKRHHPDLFASHRAPAIRLLAEEQFIFVNKAYDRMREAAVARGEAIVAGPALMPSEGWLVGFDDIATGPDEGVAGGAAEEPTAGADEGAPASPRPARPLSEGSLFDGLALDEPTGVRAAEALTDPTGATEDPEAPVASKRAAPDEVITRARAAIGDGGYEEACELLAAALHADPRNRTARALYHVAIARAAMARHQTSKATTQIEAALAHDPECDEARESLEVLRAGAGSRGSLFKRLFR